MHTAGLQNWANTKAAYRSCSDERVTADMPARAIKIVVEHVMQKMFFDQAIQRVQGHVNRLVRVHRRYNKVLSMTLLALYRCARGYLKATQIVLTSTVVSLERSDG